MPRKRVMSKRNELTLQQEFNLGLGMFPGIPEDCEYPSDRPAFSSEEARRAAWAANAEMIVGQWPDEVTYGAHLFERHDEASCKYCQEKRARELEPLIDRNK